MLRPNLGFYIALINYRRIRILLLVIGAAINITIPPNQRLGAYQYRYIDKLGNISPANVLISLPLRETECASCKAMIEDQFKRPKVVFAGSQLQALYFAQMTLASSLQNVLTNQELKLISFKNFDECSEKKEIDIFDVLATKPDYECLGARRHKNLAAKVNFTNIALEEWMDFKANGTRVRKPVVLTLAVPVKQGKFWYCSYFISGVMMEPRCVQSSQSLAAVSLALREMYIVLKAKMAEGKFFMRTFYGLTSLDELDLNLYFWSGQKS